MATSATSQRVRSRCVATSIPTWSPACFAILYAIYFDWLQNETALEDVLPLVARYLELILRG